MFVTSIAEYGDVVVNKQWGMNEQSFEYSHFYYVQGGETYYRDNSVYLKMKPGYLYIFPINKKISTRYTPGHPLDHLYCHIMTTPKIESLVEIEVVPDTFLSDALLLLKKNIRNPDRMLIQKLVDLIVNIVFEENELLTDQVSVRIKREIDEHPDTDWTLDLLAETLHYSKAHIIRTFRRDYHITPMQYFINRRLEESLNLLRSGVSVTDVTCRLHFSSSAAFSASFKSRYGLSPTAYLKYLDSKFDSG